MAAEHAQAGSKGLLASCPQMGVPLGLILASVIFNQVTVGHSGSAASSDFVDIAWRTPFLFSLVLVAVGLAVRLSVVETPAFERVRSQAAIVAAPVVAVLRDNWKTVLLAAGSFVAINGGFYLVTTEMVSYGAGPHSILKLDPRIFFNANLAGSAVGLLANPLGGWLSDRIGRRPVYMAGVGLILILAFPTYALVDSRNPSLIVLLVTKGLDNVIGRDAYVSGTFDEHLQHGVEHAGNGSERPVLPLVDAAQAIKMAEEFVGSVDEVNDQSVGRAAGPQRHAVDAILRPARRNARALTCEALRSGFVLP